MPPHAKKKILQITDREEENYSLNVEIDTKKKLNVICMQNIYMKWKPAIINIYRMLKLFLIISVHM